MSEDAPRLYLVTPALDRANDFDRNLRALELVSIDKDIIGAVLFADSHKSESIFLVEEF